MGRILISARTLRRSPGFTTTAVLVLTLGIGATTSIFSVIDKVLLQPLPYPDPDRLVQLRSESPLGDEAVASIPEYIVWRDNTSAFSGMAAYDIGGAIVHLTSREGVEALACARVTALERRRGVPFRTQKMRRADRTRR